MDHRVQKVISLMQSDLNRKVGLDELAHVVNLSSSRLCHLFKEETGTPPQQFLKALRMEKAKYLLETTFLSVKQIMNLVGISDESHFVRDFQRTYGLSPLAYRVRGAVTDSTTGQQIAKSANKIS